MRCSSTPSADTLVKPPGSTRRTCACSVPAPPQCNSRTGVPGRNCTASADSTSASISSWAVSPISISACPTVTGVALSSVRLSTTPVTGATTATGCLLVARGAVSATPALSWPAARPGSSCHRAARASSTRCRAACASACAADSSAAVRAACAWACSSASCDITRPSCSRMARCRLLRARPLAAWAACTRCRAARCWLRAAASSASARRRLRPSSRTGDVGSIHATTCPACTASPGCSATRRNCPATGAASA